MTYGKIQKINQEIMKLQCIINDCETYMIDLQCQYDRNRELYMEGYGDSRTMSKITRQLENEMHKTTSKRNKALEKLMKLQRLLNQ